MSWFGRGDGRSRIGLISLEVSAAHRRKGYGRFLVSEIFRRARENQVDLVAVQTAATNAPALLSMRSLGFQQVEQATCFRLPAETISARNSSSSSKGRGSMARRTLNRHELRAEAEAAEAMGLSNEPARRAPRARSEPALRPKPAAGPRMRDRLGCLRRRRSDGEDL